MACLVRVLHDHLSGRVSEVSNLVPSESRGSAYGVHVGLSIPVYGYGGSQAGDAEQKFLL
jgi:hypothetical protein